MASRRYRLWQTRRKCFWCEKETIYTKSGRKRGKPFHPDEATLDHIYPKGHPLRNSFGPNQERTVLACYHCNSSRGNSFAKMKVENRLTNVAELAIIAAGIFSKRQQRALRSYRQRHIWKHPVYQAFDFCVD
jgi:hypothetical protein